MKSRQFVSARSNSSGEAAGGRFGLVGGERVVALDGHEAQVSRGEGAHDTHRRSILILVRIYFVVVGGVGSAQCGCDDRTT